MRGGNSRVTSGGGGVVGRPRRAVGTGGAATGDSAEHIMCEIFDTFQRVAGPSRRARASVIVPSLNCLWETAYCLW